MTKSEFETLYQEHFTLVYRFLLKLCQDQHEAEELTSETFFKALKSIDKFDGKCHISTWLCQIAKNTYYSSLRHKKNHINWDEQMQEDSSIDIEKQLIDTMISKEIYELLQSMEEPYRKVFTLRVIYECSFKQIGSIFGKTENWACVTYHRAKAKIHKRLEDDK